MFKTSPPRARLKPLRAGARRDFGTMTQKSEESGGVWWVRWWSDLAQDLHYSFRGMRRDAGFTAFAILIAGLGIGASSTVFSVVNALLLRPLPFRDPGRLIWIANGDDLRHSNRTLFGPPGIEPIVLRSGGHRPGSMVWAIRELTGTGEPERLTSVPVTGNFFALLGVQPAIGRSFTTEECQGRYCRSAGHALELQLLAAAVCLGPERGRPEADIEQSAGERWWACCPHPSISGASLPPAPPIDIFVPWPLDGQNKAAREYDEDHRKTEARRDGAGRAGGVHDAGETTREPASGTEPYRLRSLSRWSNT